MKFARNRSRRCPRHRSSNEGATRQCLCVCVLSPISPGFHRMRFARKFPDLRMQNCVFFPIKPQQTARLHLQKTQKMLDPTFFCESQSTYFWCWVVSMNPQEWESHKKVDRWLYGVV